MTRRPRLDEPGAMHHVVNRGVAKRALFDGAKDMRYFQSRLARSARRGEIRVHAFSLVVNHYHLFLESVTGDLSSASGLHPSGAAVRGAPRPCRAPPRRAPTRDASTS